MAKRSRGPRVRRRRPHARAAETIFTPSIDPERSSTKTTSRAAPRNPSRTGRTMERKAQLHFAVLQAGQPLRIRDADRRFFARRDVPDLQRENVAALLLEERCPLSGRDGVHVFAARGFPLLDLAFHGAAGDAHLEA